MFSDKSNKWLRRSIKQFTRVFLIFRYRYFWTADADFEDFQKTVIDRLAHQLKLMQDELDKRLGRC
jgi:hypothetical protein